MGYSTRYELDWQVTKDFKAEPLCSHDPPSKAKFCSECGSRVGEWSINDLVASYIKNNSEMSYVLLPDGSSNDMGKWYESFKDLEQMSKIFPGVLFHLFGEGEQSGDIWDAWALDGRIETKKAKIVRGEAPAEFLKHLPKSK